MPEYIDREAAIDRLCEFFNFSGEYGTGVNTRGMLTLFLSAVPTADVQPVVHGEWERNPDVMDCGIGWVCSVCHSKPEAWWAAEHKLNPLHCSGRNFCPYCGAKMDLPGEKTE